jgi:Mrr N-terminal domain
LQNNVAQVYKTRRSTLKRFGGLARRLFGVQGWKTKRRADVMSEKRDGVDKRVVRRKARTATLDALKALGGEARRNAIREKAIAQGGFTADELAAPAPNGAASKYPCLVDYELSWALTNLKHDGLTENPKWGTWRLTSAAYEPASRIIAGQLEVERLAELKAMPYRQYLRTPEWRRTRAAALKSAENCCSLDVTHTEGLEVHHRTYERLGAELASDLVVLCHACHRIHHAEWGRPRREAIRQQVKPRAASTGTVTPRSPGEARQRTSLFERLLGSHRAHQA